MAGPALTQREFRPDTPRPASSPLPMVPRRRAAGELGHGVGRTRSAQQRGPDASEHADIVGEGKLVGRRAEGEGTHVPPQRRDHGRRHPARDQSAFWLLSARRPRPGLRRPARALPGQLPPGARRAERLARRARASGRSPATRTCARSTAGPDLQLDGRHHAGRDGARDARVLRVDDRARRSPTLEAAPPGAEGLHARRRWRPSSRACASVPGR